MKHAPAPDVGGGIALQELRPKEILPDDARVLVVRQVACHELKCEIFLHLPALKAL